MGRKGEQKKKLQKTNPNRTVHTCDIKKSSRALGMTIHIRHTVNEFSLMCRTKEQYEKIYTIPETSSILLYTGSNFRIHHRTINKKLKQKFIF